MASVRNEAIVEEIINDGGKLRTDVSEKSDGSEVVSHFTRIYEVIRKDDHTVEWRLFLWDIHDDIDVDPFIEWHQKVFEYGNTVEPLGMGKEILDIRAQCCKTLNAKYDLMEWAAFFNEMESQHGIVHWHQQYDTNIAEDSYRYDYDREKLLEDVVRWRDSRDVQE